MRLQARTLVFFNGRIPSETVYVCLKANISDDTRNIPGNDIAVSNLLTS